jgi:hypothetical protein
MSSIQPRLVGQVLEAATAWASAGTSISAMALVGSHARSQAQPESDVDLMFLATDPDAFRSPLWILRFPWPEGGAPSSWRDADYGVAWSRHFTLTGGLEAEFGFAPLSWAAISPIDPGTRRVIGDGYRILYDPAGLLERLVRAVQAAATAR